MTGSHRAAGAALIAPVLLWLAACSAPVTAPPLYRAASAATRDISIAVEAAGVVEPVTTVEVKSKASGEVLELNVDTGQVVVNGALMVRIDQRTPRNNVAQAEAGLEVAKARLENSRAQLRRTEQLFKAKSLSEVDYERATLDVANTRADVVRTTVQLQNARIAMEDTDVRAPITGTIIERVVERGQVISSPIADFGGGSLLLKMADLGHVQVRALVDETDIGKIGAGITAKVSVTAFPNRAFEGRLRKIEPQATSVQNVTMFAVLVDLDNHDGLLKPGMNATVNIDIATRSGVLAVSNAALRTAVDAADAAQLLGLPREIVDGIAPLPPPPGAATQPRRTDAGAVAARAAAAGFAPVSEPDRARLRALREKRQRGEALTDEERDFGRTMRARMQKVFGGGGAGRTPLRDAPAENAAGSDVAATDTDAAADRLAAARRHSGLDRQPGGEYIVFVRTAKTYAPRRVRAGITDLDYTEITFGLKEGEQVMILPSASLARAQQEFKDRMNRMMRMPGAPRSTK